jgi:hypothetical protein
MSGLRQSARIPYSSKLDEIGTEAKVDEIDGYNWKCVLRYTGFKFDRSRKKQKVRLPEYTFSFLRLNLCPIWLVHQSRPTSNFDFSAKIRFSSGLLEVRV